MGSIASRDLRNHTADVLRRVADGERIAVTVHGEVAAELVPPGTRTKRPFMTKAELLWILERASADPGLRTELAELDESTDDLDEFD